MPHFKASSLTIPQLPCVWEVKQSYSSAVLRYMFCEIFYRVNNPQHRLIQVQTQHKNFFLEYVEDFRKTPSHLVRFDRYTRPSPVGLLKDSLSGFAKISCAQICLDNFSRKSIRDETSKCFFKEVEDFLEPNDILKDFSHICLEIGFGSGRHLLYQARQNINTLWIGVEIHTPSIEQVARSIELERLKNVWILQYDARIFLEIIPSNFFDKIIVHFPIPWKKPSRRIFTKKFLTQAYRTLKNQGILNLRTDDLEYFETAKQLALLFDFKSIEQVNESLEVISKYETRWKKLNKNIYDLFLIKTQDSPKMTKKQNFTFPKVTFGGLSLYDNLENFYQKKFITKEYLLSIDSIFITKEPSSKKLLLKITMGDFAYPQSCYVIIEENNIFYFKNPLPIEANHLAHKKLCEIIVSLCKI